MKSKKGQLLHVKSILTDRSRQSRSPSPLPSRRRSKSVHVTLPDEGLRRLQLQQASVRFVTISQTTLQNTDPLLQAATAWRWSVNAHLAPIRHWRRCWWWRWVLWSNRVLTRANCWLHRGSQNLGCVFLILSTTSNQKIMASCLERLFSHTHKLCKRRKTYLLIEIRPEWRTRWTIRPVSRSPPFRVQLTSWRLTIQTRDSSCPEVRFVSSSRSRTNRRLRTMPLFTITSTISPKSVFTKSTY